MDPAIDEFAVCKSRNRLPAAVTESPLSFSLHGSYEEVTGGQVKILQCSFHHIHRWKLPQYWQGNNKNLALEPDLKTVIFSACPKEMTSLFSSVLFDEVSLRLQNNLRRTAL